MRKRDRETENGRAKDISFILGCDVGTALHTLRIQRMCVYNLNNLSRCAGVLLASLAGTKNG